MKNVINPIEFSYGGGNVKMEFLPKQIIVNFFGARMDFLATKAALRDRCRTEIRKAGMGYYLDKVLSYSRN